MYLYSLSIYIYTPMYIYICMYMRPRALSLSAPPSFALSHSLTHYLSLSLVILTDFSSGAR